MKSKETLNIVTDRLLLRKLTLDDADAMFNNWTSDHEVSKYVPWETHKSIETTKKLLNFWVSEYDNDYKYRWIVVLKDSDTPIGTIDVVKTDIENKSCVIGYCYGKKWWGNGYATEALKAVIDFLFDIGFVKITADHYSDNLASGKVMQKAGMKYDHTLKEEIMDKQGKMVDVIVYKIENN